MTRLGQRLLAAALALAALAPGIGAAPGLEVHKRQYYPTVELDLPPVPQYNVSLPVDHFNASDTRTFNNRFFVNDTYYKPGGPVIFYDNGQGGISDLDAAQILAAWNGSVSAPLELAKALNGVVIGWEHRYYGYSHPFPLQALTDDPNYVSGLPAGGARDYSYLTVEQALEDVAYFANRLWNKTSLSADGGNAILGGANATERLDPYHTPWIWVGSTYSGARGVWLRDRNPEVVYAVWSSSALMQAEPDASAYFNTLYRALPRNCTADIQAVSRHVDNVLLDTNQSAILELKALVNMAIYSGFYESNRTSFEADTNSMTETNVANFMFPDELMYWAEEFGVGATNQRFCDFMESFDVAAYQANASLGSPDLFTRSSVFMSNKDNATPIAAGIVASAGVQVGLAAYLYALPQYHLYWGMLQSGFWPPPNTDLISNAEDYHSSSWQLFTELGQIPAVNASSPFHLGSRFQNFTASRQAIIDDGFATIQAAIPAAPNTTYVQKLGGGWDARPSNVMFTDGEFNPWRAFGVMSLEKEDLGAPQRKVSQDIPKCGEAAAGDDVFGLLYGGGANAEDMLVLPGIPTASVDLARPPIRQGVELFVAAYDAWLPCFNASRDQVSAAVRVSGERDVTWLMVGMLLCTLYAAI